MERTCGYAKLPSEARWTSNPPCQSAGTMDGTLAHPMGPGSKGDHTISQTEVHAGFLSSHSPVPHIWIACSGPGGDGGKSSVSQFLCSLRLESGYSSCYLVFRVIYFFATFPPKKSFKRKCYPFIYIFLLFIACREIWKRLNNDDRESRLPKGSCSITGECQVS